MKKIRCSSLVFAASVALAAIAGGIPSNAEAATYTYNFAGDFGPPAFTATANLDVTGGQAQSGTGTITFGSNTFDLTLITLTTDGGNGNYSGTTGFRDNHGTDIFGGDTVVPVDPNGLIFAITNNPVRGQDALFAVSDAGGGNFSYLISGTLAGVFNVYYETATGPGGFSVTGAAPGTTPLPAALPMFATGIAGIGFLRWRKKKNTTLTTA
jgi:hypothetical protein